MAKCLLLPLLLSVLLVVPGPVLGQTGPDSEDHPMAPDFGGLSTRERAPKPAPAATVSLTPSVQTTYLGSFEYGTRLGVGGPPAAFKKIRSVAYALGRDRRELQVPYGQSATLRSLAEAGGFTVFETKNRGQVAGGTGFPMDLRALPMLSTLYVEATATDGSTHLVGGHPWLVDLSALVPRPPKFELQVTPSYVPDPPESSVVRRALAAVSREDARQAILRSMRLRVVADPKEPGEDLSRLISAIDRVEYCSKHTMTLNLRPEQIPIRTAVLDRTGTFSIDLPEHPDTRRFGANRTCWVVCVALRLKSGQVWTFWTRKNASVPVPTPDKRPDEFERARSGQDLAGRTYIDRQSLPRIMD